MHCRQSTYEKENYKNNVVCIIFTLSVYPKNMIDSCLRYEKIMNECEKNYEYVSKITNFGEGKYPKNRYVII